MVQVLTLKGNFIEMSNGQVRHLLKDQKAKIVKRNPFTIQLLYELEDESYKAESSYEAESTERIIHMTEQNTRNILVVSNCLNQLPTHLINNSNFNIIKMTHREYYLEQFGKEITDTIFMDVRGIEKAICNVHVSNKQVGNINDAIKSTEAYPYIIFYTFDNDIPNFPCFIDNNILVNIYITKKDLTKPNIVISNDSRFPYNLGISPTQTDKIPFKSILNPSFVPKDYKNIYIDVDSINEDIYKNIKDDEEFEENITFFRYLTPNYMCSEKVLGVKSNSYDVRCLEGYITYYNGQNYAYNNIISGPKNEREYLIDNIILQYQNKGSTIIELDFDQSLEQIVENVKKMKQEMFSRFQTMEYEKVNSIYKCNNYYDTKVIVIKDFDKLFNSKDYKSITQITTDLETIVRLGRAAAMVLVLGISKPHRIITEGLLNNIRAKVVVGPFDQTTSEILFDKDCTNIHLDHGKGLVKIDDTITVFDVDSIPDLVNG